MPQDPLNDKHINTSFEQTVARARRRSCGRSFPSIGAKLTRDEERQILAAAEAEGKAPSEWARDLLLRGAATSIRAEMEVHIFTELVGIQMLLMNALEPLLRGEKMAQEQLAGLYRRIQRTKAERAKELLAKRNLYKEK